MIEEPVLRALKKKAAAEGTTLQAVTNALLRQALDARSQLRGGKLELRGHRAELRAGVDLLDRDKLFDLMDGR